MDERETRAGFREEILRRLTEALEKEAVRVWFQPQYDHAVAQLRGAEALVRWQLPDGELVQPDSFIPLLEESGRITELDLHVFSRVCRLQHRNLEEGRSMLPLSVNLSRRDLLAEGFVGRLEEIRSSYDVPVCWLCLEITESAFVTETGEMCAAVERLRALGYTVRLDDFGSGYSGLNVLKDMEVDAIKLDMRFLGGKAVGAKSAAIITSVVRMAKWLELDVVAEGVETKEEADFLHSIGCDLIQGYFYARPMPEGDYLALLEGVQGSLPARGAAAAPENGEIRPIRHISHDAAQSSLLLTAMDKLVQNVGHHVFVKDLNFVYHAASPVFAAMTGHPAERIIGRTDFEIFPAELARRYREDDMALLASGEDLLNFVEPMTREDGKPRYGSTSKYILRDARGTPVGLMGISRDVTMEYYIRRNQRQELSYLFSLPEDVYFAAYIDLTDWRIIAENRQQVGKYCFGAHNSLEELGRAAFSRIADLRWPAYSFYRDFSPQALREAFESGRREIYMEYRRKMSDDSLRWVRDELMFFRDHSNNHPCVMMIVRDVQQQKEEEQARIRRAERDELTGVLSRSATMRLIREVLEKGQKETCHALFMIDTDRFKEVNDTFGHQEGDRVLAEMAAVIRGCFRDSDLVGRIGGDEFFVLMKLLPNRKAAEEKAELLRQRLNGLYAGNGAMRLSGSIGVAFSDRDGDSLESLYKAADEAMYRAKQQGRNRVCFYDEL